MTIMDRMGVFYVSISQLMLQDTGPYWCGIEKPYADLLFPVKLVIEEPVSDPVITAFNSLEGSCLGNPVNLGCECSKGSPVYYKWIKKSNPTDIPITQSKLLTLHCGIITDTQQYYCVASNSISQKSSALVNAVMLTPAKKDCSYLLHISDHEAYTCGSTTPASTVKEWTTYKYRTMYRPTIGNNSIPLNISINTQQNTSKLSAVWGDLRWVAFAFLVVFFIAAVKC
nr:PREDICTED: uncharacterized protein LOC102366132 [Latimeria chalumnae]|eukprot:XP_014347698.1 PREDICTED: uncharacterized protein LOC102366132 [Latimeria chalumnae]